MGNIKSKGKRRQLDPPHVIAVQAPQFEDHDYKWAEPIEPKPVRNTFESFVKSTNLVLVHSGKAYIRNQENQFQSVKINPETECTNIENILQLFPTRIPPRQYFWKQAPWDVETESHLDFSKILPKDIMRVIFMYLDPASYSSAVSVCKGWKEFESLEMWKYFCMQYKIYTPREIALSGAWKQHFVKSIEHNFFAQRNLANSGYAFSLLSNRYVITGSLHDMVPILVGKVGGRNMIVGKSPKGRLVLLCTEHNWSMATESLVDKVFKAIHEVDDIPL